MADLTSREAVGLPVATSPRAARGSLAATRVRQAKAIGQAHADSIHAGQTNAVLSSATRVLAVSEPVDRVKVFETPEVRALKAPALKDQELAVQALAEPSPAVPVQKVPVQKGPIHEDQVLGAPVHAAQVHADQDQKAPGAEPIVRLGGVRIEVNSRLLSRRCLVGAAW